MRDPRTPRRQSYGLGMTETSASPSWWFGILVGLESRRVAVAELPAGTVTFLFSDLELSTRLWEDHHGAMVAARARYFEIVDGSVVAAGGTVFSHAGDGVAAAFASAPDALRAAIEAQRLMGVEDWGETGSLSAR